MLLSMLASALFTGALFTDAQGANAWNATCAARNEASVWFVFAQAPDLPSSPDFDCKGLFFDNVACAQVIGLGKILSNELSPGGLPLYELRFLPYGDTFTLVNFLNKPDGGVVYKLPPAPKTTYAATPPPASPSELLRLYLTQRNKASAATKNVALHVWTCPEAPFDAPDAVITPVGMTLVEHYGRAPNP